MRTRALQRHCAVNSIGNAPGGPSRAISSGDRGLCARLKWNLKPISGCLEHVEFYRVASQAFAQATSTPVAPLGDAAERPESPPS